MRALNRRYRGKDRPTDVLAFPAGEGGGGFLGRHRHLGALRGAGGAAAPRIPARGRSTGFSLHGFLHLMGYDHETDDGEMDALEAPARRRLALGPRGPRGAADDRR